MGQGVREHVEDGGLGARGQTEPGAVWAGRLDGSRGQDAGVVEAGIECAQLLGGKNRRKG